MEIEGAAKRQRDFPPAFDLPIQTEKNIEAPFNENLATRDSRNEPFDQCLERNIGMDPTESLIRNLMETKKIAVRAFAEFNNRDYVFTLPTL